MEISSEIKEIFNIEIENDKIIYSKEGLYKHISKRNHNDVIKYFSHLYNIINNPDYVGMNIRNSSPSFEYVKCYEDNVLVAVKLNKKKGFFYIASMYIITNSKLESRINSGRLKSLH
ncbi:PBECR2 nuclease fold domain-containing protein [uncultured Anaerococcus sp.]|uniref:PBECR3 domain-containing polyvalent protein n=1 Tax=uncultured Anaerococcus sp. TaxID=293428 RepID=UPI002889E622|nr:PBECR2 nuclease fold domain-containing protein [uncultured Anaerococcus sp.]